MKDIEKLKYTAIIIAWLLPLVIWGRKYEPFYVYESGDIIEMPVLAASHVALGARTKEGPLRFAHSFYTDVNTNNSGRWIEMSDGSRIWTVAFRSEGAKSLNLIFDKFFIDKQSCVIIYSPLFNNQSVTLTSENITPDGVLPTIPLAGELLVVEYQQFSPICAAPELVIGAVNHDYLGVFGLLSNNKVGNFGDSGDCNIDVTCSVDQQTMLNSRSSCKIIVDGSELCSGTLVNNTNNDGKPYFLTAAHCFRKNESASTTIFFFNYEVPQCQSDIEGTKLHYLTGGNMRAFIDTFDIALAEMYERPAASLRPYWSGWNLNEALSAPFHAIHHPMGDVKKVSVTNGNIVKKTFASYTVKGVPFAKNAHWLVGQWDSGTTEGGSSGCGLFDANGLLVGSLSGGEAWCSNAVNDYFARLERAWNASEATNRQLAHWLSPGSSITQIDGIPFYNPSAERISSISKDDDPSAARLEGHGNGFISGHNSLKHTSFAQYFNNIDHAVVSGIYLFSGNGSNSSSQTFSINIWSDNNGLPGDIVASIDDINVSSLKKNGESYFQFATPFEAHEPFHAGITISYSQNIDSVALLMVKTLPGKGGMSVSDGASWQSYPWGKEPKQQASLWVDLLVSDVVLSNDTGIVKHYEVHLYPQMVVFGFSVTVDDDTIHSLQIFDMQGRLIASRNINSGSYYMDCSSLPSGIYIVRMKLNNGYAEKKILKRS